MRPFDQHVKQPITVSFVQRHVSGHGNVTTIEWGNYDVTLYADRLLA